jgi:NCAIR mutase (PurE)-related protein
MHACRQYAREGNAQCLVLSCGLVSCPLSRAHQTWADGDSALEGLHAFARYVDHACACNVCVVNIDNGFGAGDVAPVSSIVIVIATPCVAVIHPLQTASQ